MDRSALDPSYIDLSLDSRAVTFENPTGARGAGGTAQGGRKGAPSREIAPGERVVLADLDGPGVIRHVWMTFRRARPEVLRALQLEIFWDGAAEPSVSVPCVDFFGVPHGRPVEYTSALTAMQEGRGFNAYFPMPFRRGARVEFTNHSARPFALYYQIDYTRQAIDDGAGVLHATFRRENPTTMKRDFTIETGLRGPGRFLGCNVGVRVLDEGQWYGEGELKIFRDGDSDLPTICGTGLEDYVGTAWGMGPHTALYAGAPLDVRRPDGGPQPDFVGFYRWHVPDPIVFERELRITLQQIGFAAFKGDDGEALRKYAESHPVAGAGWTEVSVPEPLTYGIVERVDDYCATSYVYCREAQPVPRLDVDSALADIARLPYERPERGGMFAGGG